MDSEEFRKRGVELIDYIVDYLESMSQRQVAPSVSPGYLKKLLPSTAPNTGESFEIIMEDFEKYIMPGILHWQHPNFHAYFPGNCSYPGILAQMLMDSMGPVGFSWDISPAGKELEIITVDWFGKMIGLPDNFLHCAEGSKGGGVVENTASECVLICMLAARDEALGRLTEQNHSVRKEALLLSLVAYCSKESHSCVEKAAMISMVCIKVLDTDENFRLRGQTVQRAVEEDKKHGLVPFFASISIGTTSCCSVDAIDEIGPVCEANGVWLHIDGAYGGVALICPEYKYMLKGIENASSFNINAGKWMLSHLSSSVLWAKDYGKINNSYVHDETRFIYDGENYGNPKNKVIKALRLWFVLRNYGLEGLQKYIRRHIRLAKMFEDYVRSDERFEVIISQFGLVCFHLKVSNSLNKKLVMIINDSHKLHITGCILDTKYVIRFCVSAERTTEEDITYAWSIFCDYTNELLESEKQYLTRHESISIEYDIYHKVKTHTFY